MTNKKIESVILPPRGSDKTFDITITDDIVTSVTPSCSTPHPHPYPSLLLPTLCHPHLHLDKAYLLTSNNPTYSHLAPKTASFSEALTATAQAKSLYTEEDLYLRGAQLLSTIYTQGATTARTFVEVDATTGTLPLTVARKLKHEFAHLIEVQIVAFAQEPLFSKEDGGANLRILTEVLDSEALSDISVLGTTPYVESDRDASLRNIRWAIQTAMDKHLHLDFHLDYTLALQTDEVGNPYEPLTMAVAGILRHDDWTRLNHGRTVVLGHATQFAQLPPHWLAMVARAIEGLPVHFVGLPTSDLFMMGRDAAHPKPRGTLPVVEMIRSHGINCCLGVNNVGNAFTPYGNGDLLGLACWGVGLYQVSAEGDAEVLYGCVSWRARRAIGLAEERDGDGEEGGEMEVREGMRWRGGLVVENREVVEVPGREGERGIRVPARQRRSVRDVVWDPPDVGLRRVVR
ncbi:amidohydrolase [Coniochaeta sp. 2T2.1]|nr:amidohydrolase [Coniochaeta sp. 2T2.1]